MSKPSELVTCQSCAAWIPLREGHTIGECHASPPRPDRSTNYSYYDTVNWPQTDQADWCMAWAPDHDRFLTRVSDVLVEGAH